MSHFEHVQAVATFFLERVEPRIILTRRNKLTCDGKTYFHGTNDLVKKLLKLLSREAQRDFNTAWAQYLLDFEEPSFGVRLEAELICQLGGLSAEDAAKKAAAAAAATVDFSQAFFNDEFKVPFSELKFILNLKDRKKSFLYGPTDDHIYKFEYETIMIRLKEVLGEARGQWLQENTIDCFVEYRPQQGRLFKDNDAGHQVFNTWEQAHWERNWLKNPHAKCPMEVKEFFDAFFLDEESREYSYRWLRDATFGRAEPIIVLCGMPGIGKNIFVEHLLGNLVGLHNYRSASRGFHRSQFHNGITNCRAFFLDEMNLSPEARDNLKAYHNGRSTIERKGVDTGDPESIYASIAIANNFPEKVQLEYKDRKFYTPMLTAVPILSTLGQTKIEKLIRVMKDIDYVREFASYLHYNFPEQGSAHFPKNEFFKRLCINSYNTRFRRFINLCAQNESFSSKDFNHGHRTHYDIFALQDLITHYEVQFDEKLCTMHVEVNGKWTCDSHIYKGPKNPLPPQQTKHLVLL